MLNLLTQYPGFFASLPIALAWAFQAWLKYKASRKAIYRLGDLEIEAPTAEDVLRLKRASNRRSRGGGQRTQADHIEGEA